MAEIEEESSGPSPEPQSNENPNYSLDILSVLDQVQGHHGVPIGDYEDYAAYCTRKLSRLRQQAPQLLSHAAKYSNNKQQASAGNSNSKIRRHAFCPRSLGVESNEVNGDEPIVNETVLWNLLFQAERAWARAMMMQAQQGASTTTKQKSEARRKLNKAASWACKLERAASGVCDTHTQAMCTGYNAWMKANVLLERQDYANAVPEYQTAISSWQGSERVETTLRPLLRYCQYESGGDATTEETTTTTATPKILLEFRGETLALDSYQQLAIAYLKIDQQLKTVPTSTSGSEEAIASIEALLTDLQDALALVPPELEQKSIVADFLVFHKRKYWQVLQEGRQESVVLYRALQANAQAMVDLIGDDEDDADRLLAAAHVLRFRAAACYHLAESMSDVSDQYILLQHAEQLCASATEELLACQVDASSSQTTSTMMQVLTDQIATALCRAEATAVIMEQEQGESKTSSQREKVVGPLWLHLNKSGLSEDPIVESTPMPIPIMAKGVVFDLAWPLIAANTEVLQQEHKKAKASSWRWF